ncbi:hypothetical protein SDC9_169471 [bioreactor metagenome]|uniref:Uncharacterized protein n=1 Tax=bioreactor metagenome TaxID=1076179 RepID=A0A645G5F0_9ZZZZ
MLKMAKPHMALRHADKHRPRFDRFAIHRRVAGDNRQCPRGRYSQVVHRFASKAFANGRAQHGAPITHAGIRRESGAFQVPVKR